MPLSITRTGTCLRRSCAVADSRGPKFFNDNINALPGWSLECDCKLQVNLARRAPSLTLARLRTWRLASPWAVEGPAREKIGRVISLAAVKRCRDSETEVSRRPA